MSCYCTSWAFNLLRLIHELSSDSWILHLFVVHLFPLPVYNTAVVKPDPEVRSTRRVRNVTYCSAIPTSGSGFAAVIRYKLWKSVCMHSLHWPPPSYLGAAYTFLYVFSLQSFPLYLHSFESMSKCKQPETKIKHVLHKLREGSVSGNEEKRY